MKQILWVQEQSQQNNMEYIKTSDTTADKIVEYREEVNLDQVLQNIEVCEAQLKEWKATRDAILALGVKTTLQVQAEKEALEEVIIKK